MKTQSSILRVAILAMFVAVPVMASVINDPWAPNGSSSAEVNLYRIYNDLYTTTYTSSNDIPQVNPDEVFNLLGGSGVVEAVARYAGLGQFFGYYQPTSGGPLTYTQLFNIQNPDSGHPLSGFSAVLNPSGNFGFYDMAGQTYWHSQSGLNANGEDHMIALGTSDPNVFLLAWEDLPFALSDMDYNDLVVEITIRPKNIVPEPTSMMLLGLGLSGMVVRKLRARHAA